MLASLAHLTTAKINYKTISQRCNVARLGATLEYWAHELLYPFAF